MFKISALWVGEGMVSAILSVKGFLQLKMCLTKDVCVIFNDSDTKNLSHVMAAARIPLSVAAIDYWGFPCSSPATSYDEGLVTIINSTSGSQRGYYGSYIR